MILIGIGNGVHKDGTPSKVSQFIVSEMVSDAKSWQKAGREVILIFSGGYKVNGHTEAQAMFQYARRTAPQLVPNLFKEAKSYRTHNNAVEALKVAGLVSWAKRAGTNVIIYDHPAHLSRTLLCFERANRLFFRNQFLITGRAIPEVYDSEIPGQPYWASRESFSRREKKINLIYRFLLFRPWARIGFFLLSKIWPSERQ